MRKERKETTHIQQRRLSSISSKASRAALDALACAVVIVAGEVAVRARFWKALVESNPEASRQFDGDDDDAAGTGGAGTPGRVVRLTLGAGG